jgi:hypothetical protein
MQIKYILPVAMDRAADDIFVLGCPYKKRAAGGLPAAL